MYSTCMYINFIHVIHVHVIHVHVINIGILFSVKHWVNIYEGVHVHVVPDYEMYYDFKFPLMIWNCLTHFLLEWSTIHVFTCACLEQKFESKCVQFPNITVVGVAWSRQ